MSYIDDLLNHLTVAVRDAVLLEQEVTSARLKYDVAKAQVRQCRKDIEVELLKKQEK